MGESEIHGCLHTPTRGLCRKNSGFKRSRDQPGVSSVNCPLRASVLREPRRPAPRLPQVFSWAPRPRVSALIPEPRPPRPHLVRVLVLAAIAAPHGRGRAGRSGRAEEGQRLSGALPVT